MQNVCVLIYLSVSYYVHGFGFHSLCKACPPAYLSSAIQGRIMDNIEAKQGGGQGAFQQK